MRNLLAALMVSVPAAAFAQAEDVVSPANPSPMMNLLPLLMILVVFYIALIRPQQKRMKQHQETLGALKKGDEVITGGGIVGKITKIGSEDTMTVEIAKGVEVTVLKATVTGLLKAPAPAQIERKAEKKKSDKNDNSVPSRSSVANDN